MMPKVLPLSSGPLSVSVLPVWARLLYPGRVGSPHAWLPLAVVLGSSRAEWGQLIPLHAWAPLSRPACLGKHPRPLAAGYLRATFHLQRADVVEATLHDVWTGRSELHPLALEVFLVVHGDLERRASCRVGNCPAAAPGNSAPRGDGRWLRRGESQHRAPLWAGTQPRTPPRPCTAGPGSALLLTPAEISSRGSGAVRREERSRSGTGGWQGCGWRFSRPLLRTL